MTIEEFIRENNDVLTRVCDEALSIMNYELSYNQIKSASIVYLQTKYHPSSIYDTEIYLIKDYKNE